MDVTKVIYLKHQLLGQSKTNVTRLQFRMPHAFATTLQESGGIVEHCAVKETNVDVTLE